MVKASTKRPAASEPLEDDDDDLPVGRPGRSSQPVSNVKRTPAPSAAQTPASKQARPPPPTKAAPAPQETGDGGVGGSAQHGHNVDCSQTLADVDGSQTDVDCSQASGFDTSGMAVSRRSGDNAKSILASTAGEVTFKFAFDKTGVGFIWT